MDDTNAPSLQNSFFNQARKDRTRVTVVLNSGQRILGLIKSFDKFTLLIDTRNGEQMVFKHAISTVSTSRPSEGQGKPERRSKTETAKPAKVFGNFIDFEGKKT